MISRLAVQKDTHIWGFLIKTFWILFCFKFEVCRGLPSYCNERRADWKSALKEGSFPCMYCRSRESWWCFSGLCFLWVGSLLKVFLQIPKELVLTSLLIWVGLLSRYRESPSDWAEPRQRVTGRAIPLTVLLDQIPSVSLAGSGSTPLRWFTKAAHQPSQC